MILFKSRTYRRATKLRNELLKERMNLAIDKLSILDTKEYCKKLLEDDKLKLQINLLTKILQK